MGKYASLYGLLQYLLIKHYIPFKRQKFGRIITYQLWKMEVLHNVAVEEVHAALEARPCQGPCLLQIQLQCMKIYFRMAFFT
jgi:hypothetical protein